MTTTTKRRWGSWSLTHARTVLSHDGGYALALEDIDRGSDGARWWLDHLRGKGWATGPVLADFLEACRALNVGQPE